MLQGQGHTVVTAINGKEGFEKAVKEQPALIVLDVMMDDSTEGFATAQKLRRVEAIKYTPIMMLTSVNETSPQKFGEKDGEFLPVDAFLEKLTKKLRPNDLLMIVSDHGFSAFNRGFHLNSWLHREGYLALKDGKKASGKWYADVDWSRSRAYGQGLNGIFLNLKGRESQGIETFEVSSAVPVAPPQRLRLQAELEQREGRPVFLEYRIDPGLVGGLSLRKGNIILDVSLRGRLAQLKERLIEG